MRKLLVYGLLLSELGCDHRSTTVQLAEHCIANTPRKGVSYRPFGEVYDSELFRTCRASFRIEGSAAEFGLSAIIPLKNGTRDYTSSDASIIYSVTKDGLTAMMTDQGLDGTIDRVSMRDSLGNFIAKEVEPDQRAKAQALLETTRGHIFQFY